jgi:hypothetical protein
MVGSVRFWFYKQKTKKTESSPNRAKPQKPSQTGKNRAKTEKTEPNWKTEPNRFEPVFVLKNRTEPNRNRSV